MNLLAKILIKGRAPGERSNKFKGEKEWWSDVKTPN